MVLILAVGVKLIFFPSAKDAYFAMNQRSLLKVPAGLVVIRPTHFPASAFRKGIIYASSGNNGRGPWRLMGRDVSLRDLIAAAYGETRGRVLLPFNAPTNNFDFIVTTASPRQRLQKAIHSTFGYTADKETNDADVLALKVVNLDSPGMTVSSPDEKENTSFKKGKLYITHIRLKELAPGFEQILKIPVVDETGLTNYYDVSLDWNGSMWMRLQNESTARPLVDKILKDWGLGLEPDTASIEMLVVKKVN